jgi:regulator of nucleoside diphosphate kinase
MTKIATHEQGGIAITAADRQRLSAFDTVPALASELDRARILRRARPPRDLATMNARLLYEDLTTGERREVTLVYPRDECDRTARVSVTSPLGTALLGLRAGQSIDWPFPNGERHRIVLIDVLARARRSRA